MFSSVLAWLAMVGLSVISAVPLLYYRAPARRERTVSWISAKAPELAIILAATVVIGLFSASSVQAQARQNPTIPGKARGANHMDLLMQYLGNASAADGSPAARAVTQAMGLKAIQDASDYSFSFFRVAVSGFGPSNYSQVATPSNSLALWMTNPGAYWTIVDKMFNDLDTNNIKIAAVLNFNFYQFPALAGDTVSDLVTMPSSASRILLKKYIYQFITRYRGRQTILFYELHNEMNNSADVDNAQYCHDNAVDAFECSTTGNFSSADVIKYSKDMVTFIKSLDPSRKISSGFSLPRASAYHLAARPSWSAGGPDWTLDTLEQSSSFLAYINGPFDLVSVHVYPGDVRFGRPEGTEWRTLDDAIVASKQAGKQVYVGEFGDNVLKGNTPYVSSMLQHIALDGVAYASPWTFEFYQFATNISSNETSPPPNSLEPGVTEAALQAYHSMFAGSMPLKVTNALNGAGLPRVVITSPWPCTNQPNAVAVYAVASAPDGISSVDFLVNGTEVASVASAPFVANVVLPQNAKVMLTVVAHSVYGNRASDTTPVITNWASTSCVVQPKLR